MKTKHTPGPWGLNKNICHIASEETWWIDARSFKHPKIAEHIECEANARLIAAAPDLLQAVQRGLTIALNVGGEDSYGAIKEMRAAIAKAEG